MRRLVLLALGTAILLVAPGTSQADVVGGCPAGFELRASARPGENPDFNADGLICRLALPDGARFPAIAIDNRFPG